MSNEHTKLSAPVSEVVQSGQGGRDCMSIQCQKMCSFFTTAIASDGKGLTVLDVHCTYLNTLCPANSNNLLTVSPIMVDRRCPTCISLAIFGEEKSMTTLCFFLRAGALTPFTNKSLTSSDTKEGFREMLINPGPATSHCSRGRKQYKDP